MSCTSIPWNDDKGRGGMCHGHLDSVPERFLELRGRQGHMLGTFLKSDATRILTIASTALTSVHFSLRCAGRAAKTPVEKRRGP
jgi:hypothetical protein